MRLEKHDLEVMLPLGIGWLCQNSRISIQRVNYNLEKDRLYLKAEGSYGGLAMAVELALHFFVKGGALGMDVERGYLDSALMKGDVLPLVKTTIKNHPYFCIEERSLYFYHPKMNIDRFLVDESGIELTFK